jgi:hypothetical protein
MIARAVRNDDAQARFERALTRHALAAGVLVVAERWRTRPWASATFEGVQLDLTLAASPAAPARQWLAALADADLPMRGHVAMPPAVNAAYLRGDEVVATLTVLVLIDG